MNVADRLGQWAETQPHAVAIVEDDRLVHFQALDVAVWRATAALRQAGIAPGAVVGISLAHNSALYLVVVYALARLGAIEVTLSPQQGAATRAALARHFHVTAIIGEDAGAVLGPLPVLRPNPAWLAPGAAPVDRGLRFPGGAAPWMINLSSGTTAAPKGVFRSHADQILINDRSGEYYGLGAADHFLAAISFNFSYGLRNALRALDRGASIRLMPPQFGPEQLLRTIDREAVTCLALPPSLAEQLAALVPGDAPRLPRLRELTLSSMMVPERVRRAIRRRLTPNVCIRYGTNEAWYLAYADGPTQAAFPDTVGFAYPGVEIEIVDEADRPLPRGTIGVARFRGPAFPTGYIDNPAATAVAFRGGWYYPGDLAMLSPEGALFLKGRVDDLMNYDGVKIYPADIEAALLRHPAVAEAAALPLPAPGQPDLPSAAVVLRQAATPQQLLAYCEAELGTRDPRRLYILSALPRSAFGKVLKGELARLLVAAEPVGRGAAEAPPGDPAPEAS